MKNILAFLIFSAATIFAQEEKEIVIKRIGKDGKESVERIKGGDKKIMLHSDGKASILKKLNLSEDQKSKVDKVKYEATKSAIELGSKIKLLKLDIKELLKADNPDKSAIDKKIKETVEKTTSLATIRLDSWFKVNELLNSDQKKVWKNVLNQHAAMKEGNFRIKMNRMPHFKFRSENFDMPEFEHRLGSGFNWNMNDTGFGYGFISENDDDEDGVEKKIEVKIIED
ncbi:MAG: hypothetical protein O3A55_00045 [Bacteroidetes bacterium]|nr:hypothetical protein [Bacteroidota bacterium]